MIDNPLSCIARIQFLTKFKYYIFLLYFLITINPFFIDYDDWRRTIFLIIINNSNKMFKNKNKTLFNFNFESQKSSLTLTNS